MGYNGPAPPGPKKPPAPPPAPFVISCSRRRAEPVKPPEPEDRSLLRGLFWLLFLGS